MPAKKSTTAKKTVAKTSPAKKAAKPAVAPIRNKLFTA